MPSLPIPYDTHKTDTITVPDSITATSVSVSVNITHAYIVDLKVELVAPDNTVTVLHDRESTDSANIIQTYPLDLGSVLINGDWQLRIHDNFSLDDGILNSWSLAFSGGTTFDPVTSVTGSGSQYYVTVDPPYAGTYNLYVAPNNNIVDSRNSTLSSRTPTGDDQSYTVTVVSDTVTVVSDTTPPVLALLGLPSVVIDMGVTYTDAGATCIDDNDGNISSQITILNPVDTDTADTYTVTFTCTDTSDNSAIPITRIVNVLDDGDDDDDAPTVTSITRHDPVTQTTDSATLEFNVLFSENVTDVSQDDFELSPDSPTNTGSQTFMYTSTPSLLIPSDKTRTDTITVSDSATISSVSVSVNITHAYIVDLKVELVAPDNTVTVLHDRESTDSANIIQTYPLDLGSVLINGDWQLRIHDNFSLDDGILNSWSLAFSGGTTFDPVTSVTGSGSQYYVTVDPPYAGTYNLYVAPNNNIVDSRNSTLSSLIPTGDDQSYTVIDTIIIIPDTTVDAGNNATVIEGSDVVLNATVTNHSNEPLTYNWSHDSNLDITLTNSTSLTPSFTAPQVPADTSVIFKLRAYNEIVNITDTVTINIQNNVAPVNPITVEFSTYNDLLDTLLLFSTNFGVDVDCNTIDDGITVSSGNLTDISNSNYNPDRCYVFVMEHDTDVDFSISINADTISANNRTSVYAGLTLHTNGTQTVQ